MASCRIINTHVPRVHLTIFSNCFAALPQERPTITGEEKVYASGDVLALNCTSGKSHPAAKLRWFVNGQQVSAIVFQRLYFSQHRGKCCTRQKCCLRIELSIISVKDNTDKQTRCTVRKKWSMLFISNVISLPNGNVYNVYPLSHG